MRVYTIYLYCLEYLQDENELEVSLISLIMLFLYIIYLFSIYNLPFKIWLLYNCIYIIFLIYFKAFSCLIT